MKTLIIIAMTLFGLSLQAQTIGEMAKQDSDFLKASKKQSAKMLAEFKESTKEIHNYKPAKTSECATTYTLAPIKTPKPIIIKFDNPVYDYTGTTYDVKVGYGSLSVPVTVRKRVF